MAGGIVHLLSCVRLFATPWTAACQASLSITISQSLHKLISLESMMPPNHLILCYPLLLLPSIFPSTRVFSSELALGIRCQSWSFSFSISPFNEYLALIFFIIDFFDLLAVQGTLKSLLQHHSSIRISSLVLSLLYGPTLKSVRDYWKNHTFNYMEDFPGGSDGKVSVYNVGDLGSIPGSGRSLGEGNGNSLQYYCLENPMDGGAW